MKEITEGVFFIPGQDEVIPDSNTYIIGVPSSQDLSLIDPGLTGKGSYKLQSIIKLGIALSAIKRIILTHTHFDHIGGVAEIQKSIPWAELWIHVSEAEPLEHGDERTIYGMDLFRSMCQTHYGMKAGAFTQRVGRKLQGGETLEMGGMEWEVIHIPGHSMGSIALYHPSKKILIPGDVIYADFAIGRFDLYGADPSGLKTSLHRLAERDVHVLLPGHNRILEKVPPGYILKTAEQWDSYLV